MKRSSIKSIIMSFFIVAVLASCNYGETLQSYYVQNQETPNFISVDIPVSFVNLDDADLSEVQREAYESIDKLNMLAFTLKKDNLDAYQVEYEKVKQILDDEKYQELARGGNTTDGKFVIKYLGTDTTIDELIVFGSAKEKGFAIIRVLGDDMDPAKIMKLGTVLDKMNTDESKIQDFMKFFQ